MGKLQSCYSKRYAADAMSSQSQRLRLGLEQYSIIGQPLHFG